MVFCPTLKTESLFIVCTVFFLLVGFCHCYSLVYGFRIEAKKKSEPVGEQFLDTTKQKVSYIEKHHTVGDVISVVEF